MMRPARPGRRHPGPRSPAAPLLLVLLLAGPEAAAHHSQILGNPLGIDVYAVLAPLPGQLELTHVVDFAEAAAGLQLRHLDVNGDRKIDEEERQAYLSTTADFLATRITVEVDGATVALRPGPWQLYLPRQLGGLPILRVVHGFTAALPAGAGPHRVRYKDGSWATARGYREVLLFQSPGVHITGTQGTVVTEHYRPDQLTEVDPEATPLKDERRAAFTVTFDAAALARAAAAPEPEPAARDLTRLAPGPTGSAAQSPLLARILGDLERAARGELGLGALLLVILAAILFGALHALQPGHGKTLVAGYLIGSRGTAAHAVVLGLTVTLTHTAAVYLLGLAVWLTEDLLLHAQVTRWSTLASGLLVAGLGAYLLWRRLRGGHGHHHPPPPRESSTDQEEEPDHHHPIPPPDASPRSIWSQVITLGVSGGIVPCPDALVVLLLGVSVGRTGLGLLLVALFSVGLALTLIALGLVWVFASTRLSTRLGERTFRLLGAAGAAVILLVGVGLTWSAATG